MTITKSRLAVAEEEQRSARTKGAIANLVLLGAGTLVDGPEREIAELKGTVEVLNTLLISKCILDENDKNGLSP